MPSQMLSSIKKECTEIDELNVLKRRYDRTKEKNANLKEKLKSVETSIIQANQKFVIDLEHQIRRLESGRIKKQSELVKEKKKSLHLIVESKIKEEKIKTLTEERTQLLKKIDDLNEELTRKKIQTDLERKAKSLNDSEVLDTLSNSLPSEKSSLVERKQNNKRSHSKCKEYDIVKQSSAINSKRKKQAEYESKESNCNNYQSDGFYSMTFNCKIDYLLNGTHIWKSFAPKKAVKTSAVYLKKREMNAPQRKECDILDNFMETLVLRFYRIKTNTQAIFRTACGYVLKRYCHVCRSVWSLNLNIEIGEGEISCTNKCGHLLADAEIYSLINQSQNEKVQTNKDIVECVTEVEKNI